jgi:hypothetical protein
MRRRSWRLPVALLVVLGLSLHLGAAWSAEGGPVRTPLSVTYYYLPG